MRQVTFPTNHSPLGNSHFAAEKRFFSPMENKFGKQPQLKIVCVNFLRDYKEFGHMEVRSSLDLTLPHYFLSHHGVKFYNHGERVKFNH